MRDRGMHAAIEARSWSRTSRPECASRANCAYFEHTCANRSANDADDPRDAVVTFGSESSETRLKTLCLRTMQSIIILTVRPYVIRELPGWGKLYAFVAGHTRDWLWAGAPVKTIRGKLHGYVLQLDLSKWSDRSTYFLGRWYDLEIQLFMADMIGPGDTVVDIGANRGNFALAASRLLGNAGQSHLF